MRTCFAISLCLLSLSVLPAAQDREDDLTNALIKKLGSANFRDRHKATEALKKNPQAERALRAVLDQSDAETRRRIDEILEHLERLPLRELETMLKGGRIDDAIKLVADSPKGKYDAEILASVRALAERLIQIHQERGGYRVRLSPIAISSEPVVVVARRIDSVQTEADEPRLYFLRAHDVELDPSKKPVGLPHPFRPTVICASGSVFSRMNSDTLPVVMACGRVKLTGDSDNMIIIGCSDVIIEGVLGESLIIARGKVSLQGAIFKTRIVSGQTVAFSQRPTACISTENESNPLGFIRWADAPKEKAAPKVGK